MSFAHKKFLTWLASGLTTIFCASMLLSAIQPVWGMVSGLPATLLSPTWVGGDSSGGDERDADVYPAVAFNAQMNRYLAVWMTVRNADSSSDGFDVYGVFLDRNGRPIGSAFRISDSNTAARSGFPAVVSSGGEFVVVWTKRGYPCQIYGQRVTNTSARTDQLLVSSTSHVHSPNIVYNPARGRMALTYVEGDDYLPPTFFGAETADCGNNSSSTSQIKGREFTMLGDTPVQYPTIVISDQAKGAFRPSITYNPHINRYLIAWEDRRNADGQTYQFDVYAQILQGHFAIATADIAIASGGEYSNYDTSATWTPRPAVAGGKDRFLVTWFNKRTEDIASVWSLQGRFVFASGTPPAPFKIAETAFVNSHDGQAPTGFLAAEYSWAADEYLVGMTSHLESIWGYLSLALVQRVTRDGQLLQVDGAVQDQPGVGVSIDYDNDDQIGIGMQVIPVSRGSVTEYLTLYSKHLTDMHSQDFDIWGVRTQIPVPNLQKLFLPYVRN